MTEEIITEHDSEKLKREKQAKDAAAYKEKSTKEAQEQVNRWGKTGMLAGIAGKYAQSQMALLLENQRLMNEISTDSGDQAQFKRVSIPLVRRVFDPAYCLIWDLVSMQAMFGPTSWAFFERPDGEIYEETYVKTKRVKCLWEYQIHEDIRQQHNLDKEAELTAVLAAELCQEFNEEVIDDLSKNVGFHKEVDWTTPEVLGETLKELFAEFEQRFGKRPTWIVTGKLLAAEIKKVFEFEERTDKPVDRVLKNGEVISAHWADKITCKRTGVLQVDGSVKLVECEHLLPKEVMFGYQGGAYGSGYVYQPYVPFTQTPVVLDPILLHPRRGILTRYDKRLSVKGSDFYALVTVKGHEPVVEKTEEVVVPLDVAENVSEG